MGIFDEIVKEYVVCKVSSAKKEVAIDEVIKRVVNDAPGVPYELMGALIQGLILHTYRTCGYEAAKEALNVCIGSCEALFKQ